MRKFLIASVAVLGFAGVAAAQEAPALIYSDAYAQNVQNAGAAPLDRMATASIKSQQNASLPSQGGSFNPILNDNYSGK
jgi:hypothetical protein